MLLSLALFDALLLAGSYNLLFWHRFDQLAGLTGSISTLTTLWVGSSYLLGRYSKREQGKGRKHNPALSTAAVSLLCLGVVVIIISWGLRVNDPRTFRNFVIPILLVTTIGSYCAQIFVAQQTKRPQHWLIIGSQREIETIRKELDQQSSTMPSDVIFLPTEEQAFTIAAPQQEFDGIAISEIADLPDQLIEQLLELRSGGSCVYTLVNWSEQYLQRVPPELFSNRWLVQAEGFELQPGRLNWRVKRMGDVLVATALLVLTAPLILTAAALIKLEDGGPVLYQQIRTGLYGEPYRIWKLRSMRSQAEPDGAAWSGRGDPRITRVGNWLRRLRIDELPQLICVIKGEMSLIGPRPERPEIEETLELRIQHYRTRHWVRPGLSGWAQVCFPYGASIEDSRTKLSYDLYYLRNSSLLLDILILLKTVKLVTRAEGALPNQRQA